jgi:Protein of unknown function, DUF481
MQARQLYGPLVQLRLIFAFHQSTWTRMRKLLVTLLALALLGPAPPSLAADADANADTVVLTSGNRITGRIIGFSRGQLTFRIQGIGSVDINGNTVQMLESRRTFDVELASGERLEGTLTTPAPEKLQIRGTTGARTVELRDVVRITWIGASFRERSAATFELGFDSISSGDALDWTINGDLEHRTQHYLTEIFLDSLMRRQNDETIQRRNDFEVQARRFLPDRWFALGRFEARDDQHLGLDSRFLIGGAMGATLLQSNQTAVAVYGGLDTMVEDYSGLSGNPTSVEALGAVEWDWFEPGAHTEIETRATIYQTVDSSRHRIELDGSLHRDIFRDFYWAVNVFESYDSDPPPGFEHSDFGVTLAVGLELNWL